MNGLDIKKIRESLDVTQAQFAYYIGKTVTTITLYEANKLKPTKKSIEKIMQAANIINEHKKQFLRFKSDLRMVAKNKGYDKGANLFIMELLDTKI